MTDNLKLFSEFDQVTAKTWKEAAIKDLKGADFDKRLVWKTDEGIAVQPFYTEEDLNNNFILPRQIFPAGRRWTSYAETEIGDQAEANKFIRRMTGFDMSGILLKIDDPEKIDFSVLLENVDPEKVQIAFKLQKPSPELIERYFAFLAFRNINLSGIGGFVQSDILEDWSTTGQEPDFELLAEQLKITAQAENFKGLMLSSHSFVNAGSGVVQELAFTLNKLADTIELLERAGLKKELVIGELALHLAIGGDYFFEIAKLRAIRPVLSEILKCYTASHPYVPVLSSTSVWSKSLYDPNVNMLRNTTEAMSAILGGCDAILVNTHDSTYKKPDEFSHRIALNISNLLREEAYFDKVSDPAAGSYYMESITSGIAEKILELFNEIEANGGYVESFVQGLIQEKISALKDKKENEIACRKKVYVGTNKYPNLQEKVNVIPDMMTAPDPGFPLLSQQRAAHNFEELRQRTQQQFEVMGNAPKVYLACFGNLAMRKARASFSTEFFGTAGFEIMGEFFFEDVEEGAKESAKSDADIVVMCSSDAEYETAGKRFAEVFKDCSTDKKLIVAGYPAEIIGSLRRAGADDFIHIKTNAVEFISALQDELFAVH